MTATFLHSGDASNGASITNGNDGTMVVQVGPNGAKVNALSFAVDGTPTFAKGSGPAFSAWSNVASSVTPAGNVPILFGTEEFDTANAWDTSTSRFTPQVAGYYQISAAVQYATGNYSVTVILAKNGTAFKNLANSVTNVAVSGSTVVYLNGSTDYIQIFGSSATTQNSATGQAITHVSGFLARVA
jgi:hypothetical protein